MNFAKCLWKIFFIVFVCLINLHVKAATFTWIGNRPVTSWAYALNWQLNSGFSILGYPTATDDAIINTSATYPTLILNQFCNNLTIQANANFTISSSITLAVGGSLKVNPGFTFTITGPGSITISGSSSTIASTATLSLISNATFTNNGTFTLQSDANGTATISSLSTGTSIVGTYITERYIPGGNTRGYRLLSSPVSNVTSAIPPTGINCYDLTKLITTTLISGPGTGGSVGGAANTNGFDVSVTNYASAFVYKESDADPLTRDINVSDYKGIASINEYMPIGSGILYYFRGDKTINQAGVNAGGPTSNNAFTSPYPYAKNTTLLFTGTIVQGTVTAKTLIWTAGAIKYYNVKNTALTPSNTQTVTGFYNYLSYTANGTSPSNGLNLIGNPYPSTIDLEKVTFGAGMNNTVYMLNSTTQTFGTYTLTGNGTDGLATNGASRYVLSGQGFFAKTLSTGTNANRTVTFTEAAKTAYPSGTLSSPGNPSAIPTVFSLKTTTSAIPSIKIKLIQDSVFYNETVIAFNKANSNKFGNEDVYYLSGPAQTVYMSSFTSDNQPCIVNQMSSLDSIKTIPLYAEGPTTGKYTMSFSGASSLDPRFKLWLKDNLLKDSLDLSANSVYTFNIDRGNTATYGAGRFSLVVQPTHIADRYSLLTFNGVKATGSVLLNWTTQNEGDYTDFTVQRSTDGGKTYVNLGTLQSTGAGGYNYTDASPATDGTNLYRLVQNNINNVSSFSNIVTISYQPINNIAAQFQVFPNPATANISVKLKDQSAAANTLYIKVYNMSGNLVLSSSVNTNESLTQDVNNLVKGNYIISITDSNNKNYGAATFSKL